MAEQRKAIKAAVVSQLSNITVAGGYSTELGERHDVYKKAKDITKYPAVCVVYDSWASEGLQLHRKRETVQLLLVCYAHGNDGDDQLDDLYTDIEKNLETQSAGKFLGLAYINNVWVNRGTPAEVMDKVSRDVRVLVVGVEIQHDYTRTQP